MRPAFGFGGAGDQVEQRALAGAVRTDQAQDLARLDLEAHVVDGGQCAEPFGCALDCQHGATGKRRAARGSASGCACAGSSQG